MKVLMFAHGGSYNRGCEAIVRSSTNIIKEKSRDALVYLASDNPDSDKIINKLDGIFDGSPITIKRHTPAWFVSSLKVKLFNDESYALKKINHNIIKHIDDMDVYLSIGGDNYCYGEQPSWYEVDRQVKYKGKKLVLWGCSIGEEDLSPRKIEDLKLFDLILARESITYETLLKKGLVNVKPCADPAFTMEIEELPLPDGWVEGNTIGLNFSPLVWKKNKDSFESVKLLIQYLINHTDMTIALTPHVIQEGNNDFEVLSQYYEIYKDTGRVLLLPDNLNAIQYKGYISRMRFFIGARTHATIAAYSNFVPTLVLGYSVKSRGIAKDLFGEEKYVLGINDLSDIEKLKSSVNELIVNEDNIRCQLTEIIPLIKEKSYKAVEYLNQIVK